MGNITLVTYYTTYLLTYLLLHIKPFYYFTHPSICLLFNILIMDTNLLKHTYQYFLLFTRLECNQNYWKSMRCWNEWEIDGLWSVKMMGKRVKLKTLGMEWVWYYKLGPKRLIQTLTLDYIPLQASKQPLSVCLVY